MYLNTHLHTYVRKDPRVYVLHFNLIFVHDTFAGQIKDDRQKILGIPKVGFIILYLSLILSFSIYINKIDILFLHLNLSLF